MHLAASCGMQIVALLEPEGRSTLSVATLAQIKEVERLVEKVQAQIKAANIYAGWAPTPQHYWVNGAEETAIKA